MAYGDEYDPNQTDNQEDPWGGQVDPNKPKPKQSGPAPFDPSKAPTYTYDPRAYYNDKGEYQHPSQPGFVAQGATPPAPAPAPAPTGDPGSGLSYSGNDPMAWIQSQFGSMAPTTENLNKMVEAMKAKGIDARWANNASGQSQDKVYINGKMYDFIRDVGGANAGWQTMDESQFGGGGNAGPSSAGPMGNMGNSLMAATQNNPLKDKLYELLMGRATQSLNIDRNDPIIRAQSDAFNAQQQRASRDYLAQVAERAGSNANIGMERRMAAEKVGQASGNFEAQLMGRELEARRNEIQHALSTRAQLLTDEQRLNLQRELSYLEDATRRFGISENANLGWGDLGLRTNHFDWLRDPSNPANRL